MEEFLKYLSVYALSGFKFIFGPTLGTTYGFPLVVTALLTSFGMMTTVYAFTYFGESIRRLMLKTQRHDRKKFSKNKRRFVKVWQKYGVKGIAILTPLLLMPLGGAILVNVLGGKKREIILWMWISSLFWGFVISAVVKYGWESIRDFFV